MITKERDSQKQAVYDWEFRRFKRKNDIEMSPEECTALVEDICRCYGIKVPEMKYPDGYQARESFYLVGSITLYKWARQRHTIIHEVAHYIHSINGDKGSSHGPEYFSIFAYLISEYMSIPLHEIFFKADKAGIKHNAEYPKFKDELKPEAKFIKRYC